MAFRLQKTWPSINTLKVIPPRYPEDTPRLQVAMGSSRFSSKALICGGRPRNPLKRLVPASEE